MTIRSWFSVKSGYSGACRLLICGASVLSIGCGVSNEKIHVTEEIDLGRIRIDEPQRLEIKCANTNAQTVRLREIGISCSCLRSMEKIERKIEPQDTLNLSFEYIPDMEGYTERYISLYFDDFADPHLVKIFGRIERIPSK